LITDFKISTCSSTLPESVTPSLKEHFGINIWCYYI